MGWSVFPCWRTAGTLAKFPRVAWREFQQRRPTIEEMRTWLDHYGDPNVGVVTGTISGIIVIDCDSERATTEIEAMLDTPTTSVRSGRGTHFYFAHPGVPIRNATSLLPGVDVRGDGGYVIAPDSLHPSGRSYTWRHPPWEIRPVVLPARLLTILTAHSGGRDQILKDEIALPRPEPGPFANVLHTAGLLVLNKQLRALRAIPLPPGHGKQRAMAAAAFRLGRIVARGYITEESVMAALLQIWCDRWGKRLADGERTITYGLKSGQQKH